MKTRMPEQNMKTSSSPQTKSYMQESDANIKPRSMF